MLQLSDVHGNEDFELEIEIPLLPEFFHKREYGIELVGLTCTYHLLGTHMTPKVPNYIKLWSFINGRNILVLKDYDKAGWPTEPSHDILSLNCAIGDDLFVA